MEDLIEVEMMNTASDIMREISYGSKGGSISLKGERPTTGYMVGGRTWTLTIQRENFDSYVVLDFLKAHIVILGWEGIYVGYWEHDGRIYLDVANNIHNRDAAVQLGSQRKEIAIWDLENEVEINV